MFTRTLVLLMVTGATALAAASLAAQDYVVFNGGVSAEERATAPATGTRLEFFVSTGKFLSQIEVTVSGAGGETLVRTTTAGPWLILNLPAGTYTVQAVRGNGDVQSLQIEVSAGGDHRFGIMFPGS